MRVTMFAPQWEQCGIRDYTDYLVAALRGLPEVREVRLIPAPEPTGPMSAFQAVRRYAAEERRYRALGEAMNAGDVAHVQHQYFFFGGVAPHKNHARAFYSEIRVPLVVTVHEIATANEEASRLARFALDLANRQNFDNRIIRRLLVHTQADVERLTALGLSPERVRRIIHGIPPAAPMPDGEEAKAALGLQGRRVVTLLGFLSTKKGHSIALDALPMLPPDVTLLLAGDRHPDDWTDYVPRLKAEAEKQADEKRVRITGYLPAEQIPVVMAATDVGIAPYTQTSGSGSLANLFAYGRAVVASDIPPHREIAGDLPSPLRLFRSNDSADFAEQIRALLDDTERRVALQEAARAYAERHSYQNMAREIVMEYHKMLVG